MGRTVSARIPDDLYAQLRECADKLGVSVSEVLTRAIHAYLQTRVNNGDIVERLIALETRLAALEQVVNSEINRLGKGESTILPQGTVNNQPAGVTATLTWRG